MAPAATPGEPRKSPRPQPLGSIPFIFLFTTCALCVVFLLWRRASTLRKVVAHQLNTWTQNQGTIRLSEDDGPPAIEFLSNDFDDDHQRIGDDESLATTAERLRAANANTDLGLGTLEGGELLDDSPPAPPPKA
ncbi:uncharacterized protein C8Q71DRAFT_754211 [Rhodofomes roseus]|uniref:Uncharacterized protein n=1 Tax=Rhodofomes roseus TaxID=34475 RepID=A0ABQ8KIA4_9APHY|nr:uncharacterized protein C8Q71DRAFT_754211 [Rhodofomes roseus]KAH9837734.1 hypothetical protein C8Q71DRAFT_754211 [Rhodofomes roseus]